MKLGEKHRIFLIKGNEELIKLGQDSKAQFEEFEKKALAIMGSLGGSLAVSADEKRLTIHGCTIPGVAPVAFKKDKYGYYVPNKKTTLGKHIHQALRKLGAHDRLSYKWMVAKMVFVFGVVTDAGKNYIPTTMLTGNQDKTEYLLFIPEIKGCEKLSTALEVAATLGEEITYGHYYDNYRNTHGYQVL